MGIADKQHGYDANESYKLLEGTPEEKVLAWLNLTKTKDGHFKAGDWMSELIPHMKLLTTNPSMPHPSITLSYTVQPDHCNRMYNLHGGCAATLFDFTTTLPLSLINKPGFWQFLGVSRTLNVTYFRPVPAGTEVVVEAEIVQVGKKLATIKGTMKRRSDGSVMAVCEHGKVNVDADINSKL